MIFLQQSAPIIVIDIEKPDKEKNKATYDWFHTAHAILLQVEYEKIFLEAQTLTKDSNKQKQH